MFVFKSNFLVPWVWVNLVIVNKWGSMNVFNNRNSVYNWMSCLYRNYKKKQRIIRIVFQIKHFLLNGLTMYDWNGFNDWGSNISLYYWWMVLYNSVVYKKVIIRFISQGRLEVINTYDWWLVATGWICFTTGITGAVMKLYKAIQ